MVTMNIYGAHMTRTHRAWTHAVLGILMLSWIGTAWGQAYPTKPIRFVTSETGGGTDYVARVLSQELPAALGQPVIVENRGGGVYSGEIVSRE